MMRKFSVLAAMCFFVCRAQSNAQGTTGSIWGTVKDQQGAVVVGATVGAVNEETGMMRTAVADLAGRYAMLSLSPGNYRVSASQPGFQTVARTGIVLWRGKRWWTSSFPGVTAARPWKAPAMPLQ